jgi:mRNA interferase HigB
MRRRRLTPPTRRAVPPLFHAGPLLAGTLAFCEHEEVNVISRRTLRGFALEHPDASAELERWFTIARSARWRSLSDVRSCFPDADQVGRLLVFNIRHNRCRLLVKADYRAGLLMVKGMLTHKEYDRGGWKEWAL